MGNHPGLPDNRSFCPVSRPLNRRRQDHTLDPRPFGQGPNGKCRFELDECMSPTMEMNPEDQAGPGAAVECTTPAFERVGVACTATLVPSLLLVHGLAALSSSDRGRRLASKSASTTSDGDDFSISQAYPEIRCEQKQVNASGELSSDNGLSCYE